MSDGHSKRLSDACADTAPTREEAVAALNAYTSWVIYAVLGKLGEADAILHAHGPSIERGAQWQRERYPYTPKRLHRGLLLADSVQHDGTLPELSGPSVSYTEDGDCARWFASTHTSIASAVVERHRGAVHGYLTTRDAPAASEILFHHSWRAIHSPFGVLSLSAAAAYAERNGAIPATGARQFEWALNTQSEVILRAPGAAQAIRSAHVDIVESAILEMIYGPAAWRDAADGGAHGAGQSQQAVSGLSAKG